MPGSALRVREATLGEEEERFAIDVIGEWTGGRGVLTFKLYKDM